MQVLGHYVFLCFRCFLLLFKNRTVNQDQNWNKNNFYLEGIETKFLRDPLRDFGEKKSTA